MKKLIFMGMFSSYLGLAMVNPILGPLLRELNFNETQIGIVFAVAAISLFIASPLWGKNSKKYALKSILVFGMYGFALCYLAFAIILSLGLSSSIALPIIFLFLILIRMCGGVVFAALLTASQAIIARYTPKHERTSGMALLGAASGLGLIIGPAIGGVFVLIHLTFPIYIAAILPFIMAVLLSIRLDLKLPQHDIKEPPPNLTIHFYDQRIFPFLLVGFFLNLMIVLMQVTLGFYFQDQMNLTLLETTQAVSLSLVIFGFTNFICQMFVVRKMKLNPTYLLQLGFLLSLTGIILFLASPSIGGTFLSFVFIGAGSGLILPGYLGGLSLAVDDAFQTQVAGLNGAANGVSSMIAPIVATFLYQIEPAAPYYFILVCTLGLSVWQFSLRLQHIESR
ncbi:MFS transporter [Hazenella sp. IB182357]|uniref:MFS transporter n=1 Tax=Polycladospora coralii TaxID=2771432 RepID=A0A926N8X7_9BACL|nr:MFS transporter [Polycladospora coralii]MBD1371873.1 MFS transporter [Polycladospora coralii]MBS7529334.1 MFS transporter [Polycladospora coralii]